MPAHVFEPDPGAFASRRNFPGPIARRLAVFMSLGYLVLFAVALPYELFTIGFGTDAAWGRPPALNTKVAEALWFLLNPGDCQQHAVARLWVECYGGWLECLVAGLFLGTLGDIAAGLVNRIQGTRHDADR